MMKTLTDKVDALLEIILHCDLRTEIGIDKAKKAIRLALKEQDRDTRHSAAEAVIRIRISEKVNRNGELVFKTTSEVITEAHDAIMNCNSGIK